MTAIDFVAFVEELAAVAGEALRPFFRTTLGVENKSISGGFDPVTAADRAAEAAMRALIKRTFPEHGIVGEEFPADKSGCRICLGARSDRRHQILHLRHAGLGHADRADAGRRSDLRHDASAFYRRVFLRRRKRCELSGPRRRPGAAGEAVRRTRRSDIGDDEPVADERRRPATLSEAWNMPCGFRVMAAIATPIACSPPGKSIL